MTPSPADSSPLDTLRQLKTLLDQGAITPAEYDTLKQRLLAAPIQPTTAPLAPAEVISSPATTFSPPPPLPPPAPEPPIQPAPPASTGELPSLLDMFQQTPASPPAPMPPPVQAPPTSRPAAYGSEPAAPRIVPINPVVVTPPAPPASGEVDFLPRREAAPEMRPLSEFLPPAATPAAATPAPPAYPVPVTPVSVPTPPVASYRVPDAPAPYVSTPVSTPPVSMAPAPAEAEWITSPAPVETVAPEPEFTSEQEAEQPASSALPKVLLVLGGLALLLVLGYLFMGREQSNEHLTSLSKTAEDSVAVHPETGPQAEQLNLPPATEPEVVRTVPAIAAPTPINSDSAKAAAAKSTFPAGEAGDTEQAPATTTPTKKPTPATPAATPAARPAESSDAADSESDAATPEDGDDEATTQVRQALSSYYSDLQAPPFKASQHFAPVVERLYTRQNLTPAAIETEMDKTLFPEFKQMTTSIVPGTLRVGPPAADGTRTATYTEQSRAFRVSKGQHQRTRTQVRVRFDPEYKMTYMRQEKLLESTFEQ